MNILLLLAIHFLMLSLIAVGGASATLPEMHRVLVENLRLMDSDHFSHLFAISQAAPGPNVLFVGLFGWQIAGISGAIISLLAMCGPSSLISVAVERYGSSHQNDLWYVLLRRVLTPIAIGLLLSTSVLLTKMSLAPVPILLTLFSLLVLLKYRCNPLWLIGVGALVGAMGWL